MVGLRNEAVVEVVPAEWQPSLSPQHQGSRLKECLS
jgi:hypothetical protein